MSRGKITNKAQDLAKTLLGIKLTINALRLMPYIQYIMMNGQRIDPNKLNHSDYSVLSEWKKLGFIDDRAVKLVITENFWNAINQILWVTYVDS